MDLQDPSCLEKFSQLYEASLRRRVWASASLAYNGSGSSSGVDFTVAMKLGDLAGKATTRSKGSTAARLKGPTGVESGFGMPATSRRASASTAGRRTRTSTSSGRARGTSIRPSMQLVVATA